MNHMREDTSNHSQTSLRKGVVIDLEVERRRRREHVMGGRIKELMFAGGYDLYAALGKTSSEFLEERNMAPRQPTGATCNSTTSTQMEKRCHLFRFDKAGGGKTG